MDYPTVEKHATRTEKSYMNDGIIQEVFNKSIKKWKEYVPNTNAEIRMKINVIEQLIFTEQELIEKIRKQSHKQSYEDKDGKWSYEYEELRARHKFRDELIGDSKE